MHGICTRLTPGLHIVMPGWRPVPLTYFSHQTPTVGMKLARPKWFDGTALAIGSMAPDWLHGAIHGAYEISHSFVGTFVWGLPVAFVATMAVRRRVAAIAPLALPDGGSWRLRSWSVLASRRYPPWKTAWCAWLGAASHVFIDAFTHNRAWAAEALGWDRRLLTIGGTELSIAGTLQVMSHVLGVILGVWLLRVIARRRLLEDWYGNDAVEQARSASLSRRGRTQFWFVSCAFLALGVALSPHVLFGGPVALGLGMFAASFLPQCRPSRNMPALRWGP